MDYAMIELLTLILALNPPFRQTHVIGCGVGSPIIYRLAVIVS